MPRRLTGVLVAAALQAVALVLAHELVFLSRYGSVYGEALVHSGHGEAWGAAVSTSLLLAAGLASLAAFRLARLGLLLRRRGSGDRIDARALGARALLRAYLRLAPRIVVLTVVILTIQENVERAAIGQAMPGIGVLLSPEYAGGLWIAVAVGLAVALVAALFDWRHRVLLARLRAARATKPRRATQEALRPAPVHRPIESLLGRRSALRAPPGALAS